MNGTKYELYRATYALEAEMLLDHVLLIGLRLRIDEALIKGDRGVFVRLTAELRGKRE